MNKFYTIQEFESTICKSKNLNKYLYTVESLRTLGGLNASYTIRKWSNDTLNERRPSKTGIQLPSIDGIADKVIEKFKDTYTDHISSGPDLSIADIQKILGCGNSAAYSNTYYGEYRHNGRRLVRREEFMYRRKMGMDVCIK